MITCLLSNLTDHKNTNTVYSVPKRRLIHCLSSNPFASFVFNHEIGNLSPVMKYLHGTSKPYPPPLLACFPLTTAFLLLVAVLRNFRSVAQFSSSVCTGRRSKTSSEGAGL